LNSVYNIVRSNRKHWYELHVIAKLAGQESSPKETVSKKQYTEMLHVALALMHAFHDDIHGDFRYTRE